MNPTSTRRPIIGVIGGGDATAPPGSSTYGMAQTLGKLIAGAGAILLCGGRGGVMEAAAVGAKNAGGHTIGIMPSHDPPNAGIEYAVFTGMGDGRNFLNAVISDALIAMKGEAGTLSEIALAIKVRTPVVYLCAWDFLNANGLPKMPSVSTPEAALAEAFKHLGIVSGQKIPRAMKQPNVPNQDANLAQLVQVIAGW